MSIKKHIPNFITCCNLACGFIGIVFAFNQRIEWSVYLIWLAMLFDFLDGLTARLLKVHSDIGKQLDSLADLVTFGVLPGIIIYQLLEDSSSSAYLPFLAILIAVFSALRLAKFNIDESQASVFIGMPTPANALFLSAIPIIKEQYPDMISWQLLVIVAITCSLWLVAPFELFSLKMKSLKWGGNQIRYLFIALCIVLIVFLKFIALPFIIVLYAILSIIRNALQSGSE